MATKKKLLQAAAGTAAAGGAGALNVEDVFSTYLVELTASTSYGAVTNNIDLSGEGGLVWEKARNITQVNRLYDTERGATKLLKSDSTAAEVTASTTLTSFNSDGFTIDYSFYGSDTSKCFWTFRKAPKFFDVVTYTGTGSAQSIAHSLGVAPGCIICKETSQADDWIVYHRGVNGGSSPENYVMYLNQTYAQTGPNSVYWNGTAPDESNFYLGTQTENNQSGVSYVAYLFAHNDGDGEFGPDGDLDAIRCGSWTTAGTGSPEVNLGFEPQWIMFKRTDGTGDWRIYDTMRGWLGSDQASNAQWLKPNTSAAESTLSNSLYVTPTGFVSTGIGSGTDYIYIAIRRGPMAVPTDATDVFAIDTYDAPPLPTFESSFVTDMALYKHSTLSQDWKAVTRLLGATRLVPNATTAETGEGDVTWDFMNGWYSNSGTASTVYSWMWKRAPSFFDAVAYAGTGVARTINHNLGAVPEMMWVKSRTNTRNWMVYHKDANANPESGMLRLDGTQAFATGTTTWNNTQPTASVFSVGTRNETNNASETFIAYLFASLDGVSKVGSFSHTYGTDTTVDCGFSSGARFVIVKRSSDSGDWMVFDTERGIVAGNDARLQLNDTAAEVTNSDNIDPNSSGFVFTGANGGGTYIFYAIA